MSGLAVVDGLELGAALRRVLKPGELVADARGVLRRLPRYFYRVESARRAAQVRLAEHFTVAEFLNADVREARELWDWPRYVPCAVSVLAAHLELFRARAGASVHVAANGGYRSPGHAFSSPATPHAWAAAADVFQIGAERVDDHERIARFGKLAEEVLPGIHVGQADDHLHLELGYVVVVPRHAPGED